MSQQFQYSRVLFAVALVCSCGDGGSDKGLRKWEVSTAGKASLLQVGGNVIAGETSTLIQPGGGAVAQSGGASFIAGGSSARSAVSGSGGLISGGGVSTSLQSGGMSTAGKASTLFQAGGVKTDGGTSSSAIGGKVSSGGSQPTVGGTSNSGGSQLTGGTKSIGGASGLIAGAGVSAGGVLATVGGKSSSGGSLSTGGTKATPCTTPLCNCAASIAGAAGSAASSSLMVMESLTDYSVLSYGSLLKSESGFGVYCAGGTSTSNRTATIGVSIGSGPESEIDVAYSFAKSGLHVAECECYYSFSDWFSLRRQFPVIQSFCGSTGVSLDFKGDISKPQLEAGLRITIVDTACKNADGTPAPLPDGGAYPDELWWYDIPQAQVGASWASLLIPFSQFRLGSSRTNDRVLDPRCVLAFEINYQYSVNVWCGDGCSANDVMNGSGHFEIKNLSVY